MTDSVTSAYALAIPTAAIPIMIMIAITITITITITRLLRGMVSQMNTIGGEDALRERIAKDQRQCLSCEKPKHVRELRQHRYRAREKLVSRVSIIIVSLVSGQRDDGWLAGARIELDHTCDRGMRCVHGAKHTVHDRA
jgi:hypothetical protein